MFIKPYQIRIEMQLAPDALFEKVGEPEPTPVNASLDLYFKNQEEAAAIAHAMAGHFMLMAAKANGWPLDPEKI